MYYMSLLARVISATITPENEQKMTFLQICLIAICSACVEVEFGNPWSNDYVQLVRKYCPYTDFCYSNGTVQNVSWIVFI